MKPLKIISGGQTGVDRAALDAAIGCGLDYGGAVPRGRLAEDGPIDLRYGRLVELPGDDYAARTEQNVLDADATLIITLGPPEGGTALTERLARRHGRPLLVADLARETEAEILARAYAWLTALRPAVLNVAGPRGSKHPAIYERSRSVLEQLFTME